MEALFKIMHFIAATDPQYQVGIIRDQILGRGIAEKAIFTDTLLMSLLAAAGLSVFFYLVLNNFLNLNKKWLWFVFMIVAGVICLLIARAIIGNSTGIYPPGNPIEPFGWKFIGMSAFWGMVFFYLFSLIFKRFSKYAKYCPH